MGAYIVKHDLVPSIVLISPAARACETLDILQNEWPKSIEVVLEPIIYGASGLELLECLRKQSEEACRVLVIGHNPGVESLALLLDPEGPRSMIEAMERKFPTCALALFSHSNGWSTLAPGAVSLTDFVVPGDLTAG